MELFILLSALYVWLLYPRGIFFNREGSCESGVQACLEAGRLKRSQFHPPS